MFTVDGWCKWIGISAKILRCVVEHVLAEALERSLRNNIFKVVSGNEFVVNYSKCSKLVSVGF